MAPRARIRPPPAARFRRRETHELCARLGLAPVHDPMNDELHHRRVWLRREVIPRLERGADRDLVEVLARQAELLRDDDELLESLVDAHDPDDAAAVAALPRALGPARRPALARPHRRRPRSRPSSASSRSRAATARAAELPGGDRIERVRGRLVRVAGVDRRSAPRPGRRSTLPGPGPLRRRRDRGLDRARPAGGVARRSRAGGVRRRSGARRRWWSGPRRRASGSGPWVGAARSSCTTRWPRPGVAASRRAAAPVVAGGRSRSGSSVTVSTIASGSRPVPGASSG